jgi:deoxyribose-phosphate aldolase
VIGGLFGLVGSYGLVKLPDPMHAAACADQGAAGPSHVPLKKDAQAAWLLKAITCIDLTTLAERRRHAFGRVQRLCAKAKSGARRHC